MHFCRFALGKSGNIPTRSCSLACDGHFINTQVDSAANSSGGGGELVGLVSEPWKVMGQNQNQNQKAFAPADPR